MFILFSFLAFFALPSFADAHTRWFAEGPLQPYVTSEPTALYLGVWALIAAAVVAVGVYFERNGMMQLRFLQPRGHHTYLRAASAFSMITGAYLIIAGLNGYLFSPNLTAEIGIPLWMLQAQIVIGIAFLVGIAARVAALFLTLLWALAFVYGGVLAMIEDIWVLTTALAIVIIGNDYFSLVSFRILGKYTQRFKHYALPLLRVGAGATLFVLGFSEKILHPEFGINFLAQHHWNFMQLLGFDWYSDYLFTLSAGSVEALFGLVFMLGIVTRLNALIVAFVFSIPLFLLGPIELTGHMPHFAAIALILFFGAGEHWKIASSTKQR